MVALLAPLRVTVAPDPFPAGVIVPKMMNVFSDPVGAVKFTPVTAAPFTVTCTLVGLKVTPLLLAATVYEPFARLAKL